MGDEGRAIGTHPCPRCPLCGESGAPLHTGLRDRLFGAPGEWAFRRCPDDGCGLPWLDPMPEEGEIAKAYHAYSTHERRGAPSPSLLRRIHAAVFDGYRASRYGIGEASPRERALAWLLALHPGRRADADFLSMYVPALPGGRLLDVGCGDGRLMESLRDLGWSVSGLDFDPAAVDVARSRGLAVELGTVEEHRHGAGEFDVVTASHVLEHVSEPCRFLSECRRALVPGGRIVVVTPNSRSLGHRVFGRAWRGLEPPRHLHLFSPRCLGRLAQAAGLCEREVRVTIRNARGVYLASRALRAAERAGSKRAVAAPPGPRAEVWQLLEWMLTRFRRDLGEELVLIARS